MLLFQVFLRHTFKLLGLAELELVGGGFLLAFFSQLRSIHGGVV